MLFSFGLVSAARGDSGHRVFVAIVPKLHAIGWDIRLLQADVATLLIIGLGSREIAGIDTDAGSFIGKFALLIEAIVGVGIVAIIFGRQILVFRGVFAITLERIRHRHGALRV